MPRRNPLPLLLAALLLAAPARAGEPPAPKPAAPAPAADPFSEETQQFDFALGLLGRGFPEEAAREFALYLQRFPQGARAADARFHRASALFELGRWTEAATAYAAFASAHPNDVRVLQARLRIASAQLEAGDPARAAALLKELLAAPLPDPLRQAAHYCRARAEEALGRFDEAYRAYGAAVEGGGEYEALSLHAMAAILLRRYDAAEAERLCQLLVKNFPQHRLLPQARLSLAESLRLQGRADEAVALYQELAKLPGPGLGALARIGQGWAELARGRYAEAEAAARQGLARAPLSPADALLQRAWAHLGAGELDACAERAAEVFQRFPGPHRGEPAYLLATVAFRKAEYAEAARRYAEAVAEEANPYREESAYQLGLARARLGEDAAAEAAFAAYLKLYPQGESASAALLLQGDAQRRQKKWKEAAATYAAVRARPDAPPALGEQAWLQEAVCRYALQDYAAMDACYRAVLKDYPHSTAAPEALYWVAWGAQQARRYDEASKQYRELLERHPGHELADRARYRLGMCRFQAGDEAGAAALFLDMVRHHPQIEISAEEMLWLGRHFLQEEKLSEADEVYAALLERRPGPEIQALSLYARGEAKRRQGQFEEAIAFFDRLAALPDERFQSLARYGRGLSLHRLGRRAEAREAFAAVRFAPDDPMQAGLLLAQGLLDRDDGRTGEAIRNLMHVGLLYDDREICGEALFAAGQLYEAAGEREKALSCYHELVSTEAGSYGARWGKESGWTVQARERHAALASAPPPAPRKETPP